MRIVPLPLPATALLGRYADAGAFTDCHSTDLPTPVGQAGFVEAFYTGSLIRLERWLLRIVLARPSTDDDVRRLACGHAGQFAAWTVEDRTSDQLLLRDMTGRTRSWLMVEALPDGTRLYFGSAVVPTADPRTGRLRMGLPFRALLGLHTLYSRSLLRSAARRLARPVRQEGP